LSADGRHDTTAKAFDVAIVTAPVADDLITPGKIVSATRTDVAAGVVDTRQGVS
jgi:hypothetical protein